MDESLSVTLVPNEKLLTMIRNGEGIYEVALAYTIDSQEMAVLANEELRTVIASRKKLEEQQDGLIDPAKTIIERAKALFKKAFAMHDAAEKLLRDELAKWTTEQKRLVDEARRAAQEASRKAQQEAERVAAAERAKAEEQAAEARRKAAAAEEARQAAIKAGNAKAAAKAAAEAAAQQEKANAVVENAEAKANEAIMAAQAQVVEVKEPEKIAGFGMRDNWVADLAPGVNPTQAIELIVAAIHEGRTDLYAYLEINQGAANRSAKALKKALSLPGFVAVNHPISTSRKVP